MKQSTKNLILFIFVPVGSIILLMIIGAVFSFIPQRTPIFTLKEEVIRMPLIIEINRYHTYVVVENDTVRMIIDTGAPKSLFNYPSVTKTGKSRLFGDGGNFERLVPIKKVRTMQWGGLTIENLPVVGDTDLNMIGDDILRHFIVHFDNENREIVLTRNPALIEKRGVRMPFSRGDNNNRVIVSLSLNGKEGDFLLDTGYGGEIKVDSAFFFASGLSNLENVRWKGYLGHSLFFPDSLQGKGVTYMTLARNELGGMVFDNAIVTHNIHWHVNVIGFVFLQRFRTFTIDYLNGYIYFELPENTSFFADNVIESVPPAYVNFLRNNLNTTGVRFSHNADVSTVAALIDDGALSGIEIGDTIVGVNQTIFNETAFDKLSTNSDLFHLETRKFQRVIALLNASIANEVTFHFLSDGEIITINTVRRKILYPEPQLLGVYSCVALTLQKIETGCLLVDSISMHSNGSITFNGLRPASQSDEN